VANVLSVLAIIILLKMIPSLRHLCRKAASLRCSCSAIAVGRSPSAANVCSFSSSAGVQGLLDEGRLAHFPIANAFNFKELGHHRVGAFHCGRIGDSLAGRAVKTAPTALL
jgi:hypothetical protein